MYLTLEQISLSLRRIASVHPFFGMSFLAFKTVELPIGRSVRVNFSKIGNEILNRYYRPSSEYKGFYNPFRTSRQSDRWVSRRYVSTSLQRITKDTFGDAFIHDSGTSRWGWREDYVQQLRRIMKEQRLPRVKLYDLAIWMFRDVDWARNTRPHDVVRNLIKTFSIKRSEVESLFDSKTPAVTGPWLQETKISESELLSLIGWPPTQSVSGAHLSSLLMRTVGPSDEMDYRPSDRLNIITGDNSLGKTFLLECVWWALTGFWNELPALPRRDKAKRAPEISFSISTPSAGTQTFISRYNWDRQSWSRPANRRLRSGLVIYARYDGSFSVWDPARISEDVGPSTRGSGHLFLRREQVWDGLALPDEQRRNQHVCNGLIEDWIRWQTGGKRYETLFEAFERCLMELSPSHVEMMGVGEPTRIPNDSRDIPTIRAPYGDVPILHASAGIQRMLALAYIVIWTWNEHRENSALARKLPEAQLIMLVDEMEAHLHPRWQRQIIPGLMGVVSILSKDIQMQLHVATHSPLVMASAEAVFDDARDALHHLDLVDKRVVLNRVAFIKYGRSDDWLTSPIFGLGQPRSLPAERAIEDAKRLQVQDHPDPAEVRSVDSKLRKHLADDDDFWPRWRYFAERNGVET